MNPLITNYYKLIRSQFKTLAPLGGAYTYFGPTRWRELAQAATQLADYCNAVARKMEEKHA